MVRWWVLVHCGLFPPIFFFLILIRSWSEFVLSYTGFLFFPLHNLFVLFSSAISLYFPSLRRPYGKLIYTQHHWKVFYCKVFILLFCSMLLVNLLLLLHNQLFTLPSSFQTQTRPCSSHFGYITKKDPETILVVLYSKIEHLVFKWSIQAVSQGQVPSSSCPQGSDKSIGGPQTAFCREHLCLSEVAPKIFISSLPSLPSLPCSLSALPCLALPCPALRCSALISFSLLPWGLLLEIGT